MIKVFDYFYCLKIHYLCRIIHYTNNEIMNTNAEHLLDATLLEPAVKHATIFEQFNALDKGNSFILQNDHDPVPLYYQFINEYGETFTWEHIEKGPDIFKIRITKGGNTIQDATLAEIAVNDLRKASNVDIFCLA